MTFTLDILQEITVRAFLIALVGQKEPLPADLQQKLNEVGQVFENNPTAAVNRLEELAGHPRLNALYEQARCDIQKPYQSQENNRYDKPEEQIQREPNPSERLSNVAVKIMKDPDSAQKAKEEKQQIMLTSTQFMV